MKRKSKSSQRKVEDKIWQLCRKMVFKRDKINNEVNCYTCPAKALQGANRQLGHVPWPKATLGAYLRYDLRCLAYQCYNCNINLGGMGADAKTRMEKEKGKKFMKQLEQDRQISVKAMDYYSQLLVALTMESNNLIRREGKGYVKV